MLTLLRERLRQGHRTADFPPAKTSLPGTFRGRPVLAEDRCPRGCRACSGACPTGAISVRPLRVDFGACLFCPVCREACPEKAIAFTADYRLAANTRQGLLAGAGHGPAAALREGARRAFGRSLKLRQVSAGGCSGCEAELQALSNVVYDVGRFGIQFVASPRHADGIVITGPVTVAMESALRDTLRAVPSPKVVIAAGACSIAGGPFAGAPACRGGVPPGIAVDLFIPGCPPHPLTILDGLLRMIGRMPDPSPVKSRP